VDVEGLVRQTVELLAPIAEARDVRLETADPPAGAVRAFLDAGQIQQVLTNLVMNAIQASPAGATVRVRAVAGRAVPPGAEAGERDCVLLEVVDEGEGIDPEHREHLFDPFFTTREVGSGTGLGLSIVHGIVAEHGGWIDVESRPGEGSRFSVHLPREEENDRDGARPDRG
jgi:signal transduction histidine kinase